MTPKDTREYCAEHERRSEHIDCARKEISTLSADVRVLASLVDTLAEKMDAHLAANSAFLPQIQSLITQVELLKQRVDSLWRLFWSVVTAVAVGAVLAYFRFGGAA